MLLLLPVLLLHLTASVAPVADRASAGGTPGVMMSAVNTGRWYGAVLPIAAVIYVIVLFLTGFNTTVIVVGALVVAVVALLGPAIAPRQGRNRQRNRGRNP